MTRGRTIFHRAILLPLAAGLLVFIAGCDESAAPAMTRKVSLPTLGAPNSEAATESRAAVDASPASEAASGAETAATSATAAEQRPPEPVVVAGRRLDISFDDLKFDIEKGDPFNRSLLTDKIEALNGKLVRLRGFILPSFQQTGLTQFVLVRDNLSCCFGPGAAIYDCVIVEMKPGCSTDYSLYPVAVDGTLTIREMLDPDGKTMAIYHLDGEQVR